MTNPTFAQVMSNIETLRAIADFVGNTPDDLAVTVASRQSPWATLLSTILSLRTRDEVCAIVTPRLLAQAPTPEALLALSLEQVQTLIYPTSFYRMKARYLLGIARDIIDKFDSKVPDTLEGLLTLRGVGRKSANLVMTLGFGKDGICVDTHVHRISNRLGFVKTRTPEQTERALLENLPKEWHTNINGTLIAFGRTHCTPISPKCSTCPVSRECPRVGVKKSR